MVLDSVILIDEMCFFLEDVVWEVMILDINMMVCFLVFERIEDNWLILFVKVGLKLRRKY